MSHKNPRSVDSTQSLMKMKEIERLHGDLARVMEETGSHGLSADGWIMASESKLPKVRDAFWGLPSLEELEREGNENGKDCNDDAIAGPSSILSRMMKCLQRLIIKSKGFNSGG